MTRTAIATRCPSCGRKLAPVEVGAATEVVKRKCRGCGERWQITLRPITERKGIRVDEATFLFLGR